MSLCHECFAFVYCGGPKPKCRACFRMSILMACAPAIGLVLGTVLWFLCAL